jgi:pimeloyl-ACP methyl ester carboxylesterase
MLAYKTIDRERSAPIRLHTLVMARGYRIGAVSILVLFSASRLRVLAGSERAGEFFVVLPFSFSRRIIEKRKQVMPFVQSGDVRIHYEVEGSGEPLLLVHGYTWDLRGWYDLGYADRLKRKQRLILIDSRGHGRSGKPHEPEAYAMQRRVGDILRVLDALKLDKIRYLGWSRGGKEGFGMCRYAAGRLSALLVISESPYRYSYGYFRQVFRQGGEEWKKIVAGFPVPAAARERQSRNDFNALYAAALRGTEDFSDILAKIDIPVLAMAGTEDVAYEGVKDGAARMSNTTFVSLPGLDHVGCFARSEITLPYIEAFLKITGA